MQEIVRVSSAVLVHRSALKQWIHWEAEAEEPSSPSCRDRIALLALRCAVAGLLCPAAYLRALVACGTLRSAADSNLSSSASLHRFLSASSSDVVYITRLHNSREQVSSSPHMCTLHISTSHVSASHVPLSDTAHKHELPITPHHSHHLATWTELLLVTGTSPTTLLSKLRASEPLNWHTAELSQAG